MMPAAKHLDPVVGVDVHIVMIPTPGGPIPTPIPHPFVGIVMDMFDYLPVVGSTVLVNNIHRAQAGTEAKAVPPHIPMGGPFGPPPPGNEGEMFMGSSTVLADGEPFTYTALPVLSCQSIGMIAPIRPGKQKKTTSMVLPTTVVLPIPMGAPVLIGGAPTISMMALGMKIGFAALGKAFRKLKKLKKKRLKSKKPKKVKGKAKKNKPCGTAAHPVDVVTGACVDEYIDFTSPGALPVEWRRYYDSGASGVDGPVGKGFRHEYERTLERLPDGYRYTDQTGETTDFAVFEDGQNVLYSDGLTLRRRQSDDFEVFPTGGPVMRFLFPEAGGPARFVSICADRHTIELSSDRIGCLREVSDSAGNCYRMNYDEFGHLERITQLARSGADGGAVDVLRYEYDSDGRLKGMVDANGYRVSYEYDAGGRLTRIVDRRGYSFSYVYDADGRCVQTSGEDGLWEASFAYFPEQGVTEITFGDGGKWSVSYDDYGIVTEQIDPYGGSLSRTIGDGGQVVSELDALGNESVYLYDHSGWLEGRIDHFGNFLLPYDVEPAPVDPRTPYVPLTPVEWECGRLIDRELMVPRDFHPAEVARFPLLLTDALGLNEYSSGTIMQSRPAANATHDVLGRIVSSADSSGAIEEWKYDAEGNVVEHRDRDGSVHKARYKSWNLIESETDPLGNTTSYDYDMRGELVKVADAGGTVSEYERDQKERITKVFRHGEMRESYRWDEDDNLLEKCDRNGNVLLSFTIGKNGLPATRELGSGEVHVLEYDQAGRVTMAAVNELPTTIAYDHEDVRVEDKRDGKGIERATCSADVTELTVLNNFTTRYTQVSSRHLIITDPTGREHRLRHNPVGLLLREFANGTSELTRYDHEGRCLGRVAQRTDRVTWKRRFHYSAEGDLRKVEDNVYGTSSYVYDDAHRLIGENRADGTTNTIRYDEAGNILRKPGCEGVRMNSGNRIAAVNGQRFDYDHRNNLARREGGDSTTEYEYDSRDMLVRCRNGFGEWTAAYDPLSRRMWKEWDGHRVEYYWDGERLAAEVHDGAHTRVYIYPDDHALVPMIFMDYDAPDADPDTGRAYFVFTDQLGTPVRIEDSNGTMVWAARVDPYGSVEINPQSTVSFALRFPGHYHDEETGLHYNRHRYYSPELGRYLQSDPVGQSGAVNVYAYPLNPLTEVDLEGLGCDGAANKGKAGVDAEEPKRNMWGRTDGQPKKYTATTKKGRREIAKRNGMDPEHLENVVARSKRTGETITFRGSNPASPRWHRNPHCTPKPVSMKHKTCKKKGDPREGLVVADDLSEADLKQLKKDGFKVNRDKTIVDKNGKYMYGDNDLQGVHKDGKPVDTNDPDWQDDFNDDMSGGDPKMVQHGANDQYKPKGEGGPMGRQPDNDESYVVVNPDGSVDEVQGTDALQDSQYGGHGQPDWPYDPYPPGKKKEKK